MEEAQYLEMLDTILGQHRAFGNADYIHDQLHLCYERRLAGLSKHLPAAADVLDALCRTTSYNRYQIIGDTVVRCAIDNARWQLETGTQHGLPLNECEEVLRAAVDRLNHGSFGRPLQLGIISYHGVVWHDEHSGGDVFTRAFRHVVQGACSVLYAPNPDDLAMLTKGALLLSDLLPVVSCSALSHVHLIAFFPEVGFWKGASSMSQFALGGTIFLNKEYLRDPWWVAEQLLHESLHQKLYDFRHGHSLLEPNFSRPDAPRVCSLWNIAGSNKSNLWDIHRALAAFHVYVHLALLSTVAEQRAPELEQKYGPRRAIIESRRAMDRAHYLYEQIRESCWLELGLAGQRLVEWLGSVLNALDPSPPPTGSYIHLLLDRYQREANRVAEVVRPDSGSANGGAVPLRQELNSIIKEEIESTRRMLYSVKAEADLARFDSAVAMYSDEELGSQISQVRALVSETILGASPNGYGFRWLSAETNNLDEFVRQMVESSSERVDRILTDETAHSLLTLQ
jgi:hypothetical protein